MFAKYIAEAEAGKGARTAVETTATAAATSFHADVLSGANNSREDPPPRRKKARASSSSQTKKQTQKHEPIQVDPNFAIFPGVKCADPSCITFPVRNSWNAITASRWFKVLKEAPTVNDCLSLLTLMAAYHQSHTDYAKRMGDTMKLWADVYKTWEFTMGYEYSAIAEHWFRSIVHMLGSELVPMSGLVQLMRSIVEKREKVTYDTVDMRFERRNLVHLMRDLEEQALKQVNVAISAYVMPACKTDPDYDTYYRTGRKTLFCILCTVAESTKLKCVGPMDELDIETFRTAKYDTPDASSVRFCKLLSGRVQLRTDVAEKPLFHGHVDPEPDGESGKLVLVKEKAQASTKRGHLVLLFNGALLCDCSEFASYVL